jgi:hypothetical protein
LTVKPFRTPDHLNRTPMPPWPSAGDPGSRGPSPAQGSRYR